MYLFILLWYFYFELKLYTMEKISKISPIVLNDQLTTLHLKLDHEDMIEILNLFFEKERLFNSNKEIVIKKQFIEIKKEQDKDLFFFFTHYIHEEKRNSYPYLCKEEVSILRTLNSEFLKKKILNSDKIAKIFCSLGYSLKDYSVVSFKDIYKERKNRLYITGCKIDFSLVQPEV